MSEREMDVVVIGAGPAGEVAAGRLADGGLEVVIAERHLIGGECSFYACMPSKALLRPAQALAETRRVQGAAQAVTGDLDVPAVLRRRDEIVHDLDDAVQVPWLREKGIELIRGHARLTGERLVRVGDERLRARKAVVVAVGSSPMLPPVPGLAQARPWTNREATTSADVPDRLAVLGGGVSGVELAQAYATLGAAVTLIEPGDRVLGREEEFAATQVTDGLLAAGVDVRCKTSATSVRRSDSGEVTIECDRGMAVVADELLVAAGRRPNTDDLGLEEVDLNPGELLPADDLLRVEGTDWLYSVGDVNGRALLTHMGKLQARVAADAILGRSANGLRAAGDGPGSPRVVFTEPQVAAVGHTETSARDAGLDIRIAEAEVSGNAGGSYYGHDAPGTARLLIDRSSRSVVGATFTGVEVQDFLHAATIAVVGGVSLDDLRHSVPSFPTRSEVWLELLEQAED